jgi:hypothetical protein
MQHNGFCSMGGEKGRETYLFTAASCVLVDSAVEGDETVSEVEDDEDDIFASHHKNKNYFTVWFWFWSRVLLEMESKSEPYDDLLSLNAADKYLKDEGQFAWLSPWD